MKAITYKTTISNGIGVIDRIGYPTGTPGLVVGEAYEPCGENKTPEWVVAHVRTGLVFPWCWDSPEAALAHAEKAATFGDWQQDFESTRRLVLNARLPLKDCAYNLGGRLHTGVNGDGSVDNGVIA